MTTITIPSDLLEQALDALEAAKNGLLWYGDTYPDATNDSDDEAMGKIDSALETLRAELAKPVEQAEPVAWLYSVPGHRSSASCERIPLDMCPQGTTEAPLYLHPPTPAWHDAPEAIALKAERDELLKLINRRKIHPHDIPLEIFIADLSTRTANVLRAEFDSFRHTAGTYDIEPPFTVRHLLMFSRQEIKKWPGIGKKGLNEIEENLRARGLQLWHAHDDRSLRLLREHKSYFVGMAKAEGEKIRAELAKPPTAPAWHDAPTCAGLWTCQHIDDFSATIFNDYEVANFVEPVELENCRWYGPIPQDAAIAKAEGRKE